jgi:phospholipid-binding lipoprotein MlaA
MSPSKALLLGLALLAASAASQAAEDAVAATTHEANAAQDPWEKLNRKTHRFNKVLDRYVMKPVARGYLRGVPRPVRQGVTNVFDNLQEPVTSLNLLAQGRPRESGRSLLRFFVNSVIGVAGVFDVASAGGAPEYRADFGQTFARWGWRRSRYLVLPMFGSSSVRDGLGRLVNSRVSPINTVAVRAGGAPVGIFYGITTRASALPNDAFTEGAADDYILLRDVYFQRRACQIHDCTQEIPDYEAPEELGIPGSDLAPER